MKRVISLWLPRLATERYRARRKRRRDPGSAGGAEIPRTPFVLSESEGGALRVSVPDPLAEARGVEPGLPLAEARAILPGLRSLPRDRGAEEKLCERLLDGLERYSPWVARDAFEPLPGAAAFWLDITGCAHLFGGETAMSREMLGRLEAWGFSARLGLADTPGAAWAAARFSTDGGEPARIVPPGGQKEALAPLPVAALRLQPPQSELLGRFGLASVAQLYGLPPAALTARLGQDVSRRLRQALGELAEPLSPRQPPFPFEARRSFAEPIAAPEDLAAAAEALLLELCERLREGGQGARRLLLVLHRLDGSRQELRIGVSRPSRDPGHLGRLLADRRESFDPGYGVEVMTLAASRSEPLSALQMTLGGADGRRERKGSDLVDRLVNRLGEGPVHRLSPRRSHWPEKAQAKAGPAAEGGSAEENDWSYWRSRPRPLRLLPRPEPIEVLALLPDHPPQRFRWRRVQHRVVRAEGPERLLESWWEGAPLLAQRDYYRVEDEKGRRFWLFRDGAAWFLHGLFG